MLSRVHVAYERASCRTGRNGYAAAAGRAYVFFKHEDEGTGPAFEKRFMELWGEG